MVGQKTAAEVATDDVETATARFAYETRWAGQQGTAREKCDGFATATLPVRGMARGGSKPTPACECPRQQAAAHTQADATDGSRGDGKHAARPNYLLLAGRKITRSVWHDRVQLNPEIEHGRVWARTEEQPRLCRSFLDKNYFSSELEAATAQDGPGPGPRCTLQRVLSESILV